MLIFKLIGGIIIILSTTLYGYDLTRELTKRLETLKALKKAFLLLKSEMRYGMETLPEALMHVGEHCGTGEEEVRDFFWAVGNELKQKNHKELGLLWQEQTTLLVKETHLAGAEEDRLMRVSDSLGYLDMTQQLNNIDLYLDNLDEDIKVLTDKYADSCKLYTGLGVMAGVFLTIVLI